MAFKDLQRNQNEKAMSHYIKQLEQFSLQFGIHPNELENVLNQIFVECQKVSDNRFIVYQTALEIVKTHLPSAKEQGFSKDGKKLFLYEEDEHFHNVLTHLKFDIKVPYILMVFHHFSVADIALMLNKTSENINQAVKEAELQLISEIPIQHDHYEKVLRFMNMTYSRLPDLTDPQQLFSGDNFTNDKGNEENKEKKKKSTLVIQMVGASLTILFFLSLFFFSSTNNGRIDEQYVENLSKEFNDVMEERRNQLGLSQVVFGQQNFVANARSLNTVFQSDLKGSIDSENPMKRKAAKEKFKEVIDSFQLPSEMLEELKDEPLTEDVEPSLKFLDEYATRLHQVRGAFYMEIGQYRTTSDYPEDLVRAMEKQSYYVIDNDPYVPIEYRKSESTNSLEKLLHNSSKPYIDMLVLERSIYIPDFLSPVELADAAMILEEIILNNPRRAYMYDTAKNLYRMILSRLIYGPSIYQKDMTIKEEYITAWEMLAHNHQVSPMGSLFNSILGEQLDVQTLRTMDPSLDLERAIALAQGGEITTYSEVVRNFGEMEEFEAVHLPNEEFNRDVSTLVDEIERNIGIESRSFIMMMQNPLTVVGVYDAAQRDENWDVLWHVSGKYQTFEQFMESYTIGEPILDGVESIVFDPEWIQYSNMVVPIFFVKEGKSEIGVWMTKWGPDWVIEKVVEEETGN